MSLTAVAPESTRPAPRARGELSTAVLRRLSGEPAPPDLLHLARRTVAQSADVMRDDDVQMALFTLHASAYGSLDGLDADLEWDGELIAVRRVLEDSLEQELRARVEVPDVPAPERDAVARALFDLTRPGPGPSLARHIGRRATPEQARELFVQRSIYTLREADPHSWAIPRLHGAAKAALVEIQADEYGGGHPERVHATLFADAMRGMGLDDRYGAYLDDVPAITLAAHTTMSMFGLNRRLLGAIVGHLAAFEMTSAIPSRHYAEGLRRLGFGPAVTEYFDEHVEADAVHEQIAARDLAGALAEDRPDLTADIMFGAAACLAVEGWVAEHVLGAWESGESSLRSEVTS